MLNCIFSIVLFKYIIIDDKRIFNVAIDSNLFFLLSIPFLKKRIKESSDTISAMK